MSQVETAGAVGHIGDADRMLEILAGIGEQHGGTALVMRADLIFGREHLVTAAEKAVRAFARGRNLARGMGMEIMLYAAAERQISAAIEMMGVRPDTDRFAVVATGQVSADAVIDALGLRRDDSVLDAGGKDPGELGIGADELDMVGLERITDLVLERMALSELER